MLWRDTESLKNIILYVFLQVICGIKFCLQLNTDDLTWRIFLKTAGKNVKTRFFFHIKIRISKLVSIFQEYPIKEQELKFPSFLCFGGFLTSLVIYFTSKKSR